MSLKRSNGNMGDPKGSLKRVVSDNLGKKEGGDEDALGVGSVHSRGNRRGNLSEVLQAPHLEDVLRKRALEGADRDSGCSAETAATLRSGGQSTTAVERISRVARENGRYKFRALASLLDESFLAECFAELKRNKAAGIDGQSVEAYGERLAANLQNLVQRMKKNAYRPKAGKRAYIPKEGGGKRPLGIPSVEDKIVQVALTRILQAMYEPLFLEASHGYRPGRSPHTALEAVARAIATKPVSYIVDADIKGFFDNVDHQWMMECLRQRVEDGNFLRLILRFLKAGIMEEGQYHETDKGTPQGGILSPILSNIYLHYVLDLWIEKRLKVRCSGYVEEVRYADDFVVLAQWKNEAERLLREIRERLSEFGLTLSEEKTRLIKFSRFAEEDAKRKGKKAATFEFLGFRHYCGKTRGGKFQVGRRTSGKRFGKRIQEMKAWIKQVRNHLNMAEIWKLLKLKLVGHYRYYGIRGNYKRIAEYYYRVTELLYRWLNRRSQKRSFTWEMFGRYLDRYPLPKPRLYHH